MKQAYKRLLSRTILGVAVCSMALASHGTEVLAKAPYESYTYNYYEEAVPAPDAYLPERSISGIDLGIGSFSTPQDLFVSSKGEIYIADTGNNRIVILTDDWKVKKVVTSFQHDSKEDTFLAPSGVVVSEEGNLYVADTEHKRVVVLSPEGKLVQIIENPQSDLLGASFSFVPLKLSVDAGGRVFVIARGAYEGMLQFDKSGEFIGYSGTNKVRRDFADYIWRLLASDAQKKQMQLYIPTEFSNLDMGSKGFLYATNVDPGSTEPVKRLNPSGEDVLKRYGYFDVKGDLVYRLRGASGGPSRLVDIKYWGNGMYSVLDALRGRVFTYDDEGNLLYIFGGIGTQVGTFRTPAALERIGNKQLILDQGKETITIFKPTEYGAAIQEAVANHHAGDDQKAVEKWREVLRLNSNYDIAYIGIGKSLLYDKQNKAAMEYFKLGMDRKNYSVAFKRYRKEVLQEHFGTFLTVTTGGVVLIIALRTVRSRSRRRGEQNEAGLF